MVPHVLGFEQGSQTSGMKQRMYLDLDFNNCKLGLSKTSKIRDDHVGEDVSFLSHSESPSGRNDRYSSRKCCLLSIKSAGTQIEIVHG